MTEQVGAVEDEIDEETVHPEEGMRVRTAKGVLINTAFRVGSRSSASLRNVAFAIFLTQEEYGLWGLILTTLITIAFLKQIGISDKFVQQREPDQEAAFQKAFSLELAYSGIFYVFAVVAIPVYAIRHLRPARRVPAGAGALALAARLRLPVADLDLLQAHGVRPAAALEAIDPLVTTVVTIGLLVAGRRRLGARDRLAARLDRGRGRRDRREPLQAALALRAGQRSPSTCPSPGRC